MNRRVRSADGVSLAVYEAGDPAAGTVVAVHGYPDNAAVWSGVVAALAGVHAVTYDVRGTGASDKPAQTRSYRMRRLLDDLEAVLDAVAQDRRPVHLLGHDWGSIQCWAALADPRFAGRIRSYTSISGPSLDYAAAWLRDGRRHPLAAARQLAHSYYVALFQLPWLPEFAVRQGLIERGLARSGPQRPRNRADQLNGLKLYRANIGRRMSRPRPVSTDVPVQLVVPERDAFVTPELAVGAARPWVADLTVHRLPAGHWVVTDAPDLVAGLVRRFVAGRGADRSQVS